ncbi:MAG: polysaccharide pyruvyl transferase family protein [Bacteroidota bacterium]
MQNVLLAYGYGLKNAGDMAITLGAIDLLNEKYNVKILSRFDRDHREYRKSKDFILSKYPDVTVLPSPFKLNRNANLITKIKDYINGGLQVVDLVQNKELEEIIGESDLVVFNGGNLFRCESFSDFARLIALMYPLNKAKESGTPYIIFPQSASNINFLGNYILKPTLENAQKVWCRENISKKYLDSQFELAELESSLDLAFYLSNGTEEEPGRDKKKRIAITARSHTVGDLGDFEEDRKSKISSTILNTLKQFADEYEFVFVIQTKKDIEITNRIASKAKKLFNNVSVFEEYDPIKLIEYYKSCNALLGMRLHSIILALNAGTPCVGFFAKEWGFKNPGIMGQFGLPFKYLDNELLENFSSEMREVLDNKEVLSEEIQSYIQVQQTKLIEEI